MPGRPPASMPGEVDRDVDLEFAQAFPRSLAKSLEAWRHRWNRSPTPRTTRVRSAASSSGPNETPVDSRIPGGVVAFESRPATCEATAGRLKFAAR